MAHHGVIAAHVNIARAFTLAVTVETLVGQYLRLLPMDEQQILPGQQIAEVLVKFKTYGQEPVAAVAGLRRGVVTR